MLICCNFRFKVRMMKKLLASVFLIVLPVALVAQTPAKVRSKAASVSKSRLETKILANQKALGIRAAEAALSPAELAISELIYQGALPCELGAFVTLTADAKFPGYFDLEIKNQKFRLFPVETSTGAIRLEDPKSGAVWLQLSNKSMLLNQKLGQRLALMPRRKLSDFGKSVVATQASCCSCLRLPKPMRVSFHPECVHLAGEIVAPSAPEPRRLFQRAGSGRV